MSGSLYFSSITVSDSAAYHCTVTVDGGAESRTSPAYNLVVDTSPSEYFFFTIKPSISVSLRVDL